MIGLPLCSTFVWVRTYFSRVSVSKMTALTAKIMRMKNSSRWSPQTISLLMRLPLSSASPRLRQRAPRTLTNGSILPLTSRSRMFLGLIWFTVSRSVYAKIGLYTSLYSRTLRMLRERCSRKLGKLFPSGISPSWRRPWKRELYRQSPSPGMRFTSNSSSSSAVLPMSITSQRRRRFSSSSCWARDAATAASHFVFSSSMRCLRLHSSSSYKRMDSALACSVCVCSASSFSWRC
mmetsp:Transcript_32816/g.61016  ORF Transcript_32816/g.61016 Transcript_32816/m.61016 type:complete len:234 (-) Transcript_32816:859-1560(-)